LAELGVAYLRVAEVTNCVGFHTPEMCIFPIGEGGRHPDPTAARKAIQVFQQYLKTGPPNQTVRWLLTIAAMTAGEYPRRTSEVGVPVISTPLPEEGIGLFPNVAPRAGLEIFDNAGGGLMDDFDGDGLLDIVTSSVEPCTPLRFFRNDGRGGFENHALEAGLEGQLGGQNLIHADYDNDGHLDIFVLRGGWFGASGRIRNSLLLNNGDGTFADVTFQAGLAEPAYPVQTGAWADYDLDGDLDLYLGNEGVHPTRDCCYPAQLFRNNGDRTFTDVAESAGVTNLRYAKGVTWGDYDEDGDPDLYVSNLGPNRLYRNNGDGTFTDLAPLLGLTEPAVRSFPTWFWDYDNDGFLDLFVAEYRGNPELIATHLFGGSVPAVHPRLYRNRGEGIFEEVSAQVDLLEPSLPMGANFGDLDNDGFLDFYLGTGDTRYEALMPNLMYRNDEGRRFVNVTYAGGFGHLQKGHGIAFGDIDNDGDQDVFEQMGGAFPGDGYPSALYQNPGHGHHWVTVKLVGKRSNRAALGTRLKVELDTPRGPRTVYRQVGPGGSFGGSPLRIEIGLGDATAIERLEVFWPASDLRQEFREVAMDSFYRLEEGDEELTPVKLPRLDLGARSAPGERHQH
jgi:hypothetical protein